jgi:hypothetical protein
MSRRRLDMPDQLPRSSSAIRRKKHRNFAAAKKNLRDRRYRVLHSLTAIKLFPKQKEAAVFVNKIRHTNLHYFLDSFNAIFTTNSLVSVSEAAHTWFASLVKWTGLDGPGIEPRVRAHPATCTTGTESFPRVKRPGCGVGHPPPKLRRS